MKRLSVLVALLLGGIVAASAIFDLACSVDWTQAEDGVSVDGEKAFSGCAPAGSLSDQLAHRAALLRAQANVARSKRLAVVSGEEHLATDRHGDTRYDMVISDASAAYLHPVKVVSEEIARLDNVSQLCVLVVEGPQ